MLAKKDGERKKYKKVLTKSNYLLGLQCSKLLHVKLYDKTRIPESDKFAFFRFAVGMKTEDMAKTLFPTGIDIPHEDFLENLEQSKKLIEKRVPLFEPSFKFDQCYSRADVLVPVENDQWDIVEMKSATKVKDVNIHDVSFQKYVYENCGLKIRKCFLMHINRDYIRQGEIEPDKLFMQTEITEEVKKLSVGIESRINEMLKIVNSETEPDYEIGDHCCNPYECPIKKECWTELPNGNILDYYRNYRVQCFALGSEGNIKINKIPDFYAKNLRPFQKQAVAVREGEGFEKRIVGEFLEELEYPLYYLDIQSINPAVPLYNGMKPYKKFPFQFSLHIQQGRGSKVEHVSYLANGSSNPMFSFLKVLKDNIGNVGTILVYDKFKEGSILKDLMWNFRSEKPWIENDILPRIKDFWSVFENFHYFDVEKSLNHEIRYLLPRFCDLKHTDLDIEDGESRGLEFEALLDKEDLSDEEVKIVRNKLIKGGRADTLSMIHLVDVLGKLTRG